MARIRTIKPEFWSSPDTAACADPWARLLFVAMWNWADDAGRGTANPKELGGFAFPNEEDISSADIRRMLGGIRRAFGVDFYVVDGRPYYAIPSWEKHQKIDKRSGAKYPAPEDGEPWNPDPTQPPDQRKRNGSTYPAESSAEPVESTPTPRRTLGAGTGEQGNRGTTTSATATASAKTDDGFDRFWVAYPRKVKKDDARKAWRQMLAKRVDPERLIAAAKAQADAWRAEGKETKYVLHPSSWLRSGAWADEAEPTRLTVVPTLPQHTDPDDAFADLRRRAAGEDAARLLGIPYLVDPKPPSDPTHPRQWDREQAIAWIDRHADQLRAALTERRTG